MRNSRQVSYSKGEFGLKFQSIYNKDGIIFKPYPVYKHSINGVSERHLYMTNYKARLLLFNIDLLKDFQCLTIKHIIQVKNKVFISALSFSDGRFSITKTLYKAYNNKVLNLVNLKVFSYIIYLILQKGKHLRHFKPRHRPGFIFIGILGLSI